MKEILGHVEILQTSMSKDTVIHIIQYQMQDARKAPEAPAPIEEAAPAVVPEPVLPEVPEKKTPARESPLNYLVLANVAVTPDLSYGLMLGANWTLPSGGASSKSGYLDLELGLGLYF